MPCPRVCCQAGFRAIGGRALPLSGGVVIMKVSPLCGGTYRLPYRDLCHDKR